MYATAYTSSVSRYLKFRRLTRNVTWPSGLTVSRFVNGGTCTALSAKLILKAKANGMRKNTARYRSGGRMMSQRPRWRMNSRQRLAGTLTAETAYRQPVRRTHKMADGQSRARPQ